MERKGDVTFQGAPLTAMGPKLQPGHPAPEFHLLANDLSAVNLSGTAGKIRLVSVVPSLDTPVCDLQTRTFNERVSAFGDGVIAYTISADLPFAQARWCGAAGVQRMQTLSDHYDLSFGDAYGTHIKELRLEQRAVFIIDGAGIIRYVEYVQEITQPPDFEAALTALKALAK